MTVEETTSTRVVLMSVPPVSVTTKYPSDAVVSLSAISSENVTRMPVEEIGPTDVIVIGADGVAVES
jgi:hypothetical protein